MAKIKKQQQNFALFEARIKRPAIWFDPVTEVLGRANPKGENDSAVTPYIAALQKGSPYLKGLIKAWPDFLPQLDAVSPEAICDDLLLSLQKEQSKTDQPAHWQDYDALCILLRQIKQKLHLLCAICDVARVWTWQNVGQALSDFSDRCMQNLIDCLAPSAGIIPTSDCSTPGFFVLALGKYGGRELNYSSDIDIIVFYDPSVIQLGNPTRAERLLLRFVKKIMRGFDAVIDGYVFRTDLRLRPDPRSNSVLVSTHTAERYYEVLGQNWERAAMIKARFCGGDAGAANAFIDDVLRPFIWRRSLDYSTIEDIHSIKRQIQGSAGLDSICVAGHDVKLGIGGIREIEFYTQVQQLILGGRHENLRAPRTIDALATLAQGGYADPLDIEALIQHYGFLRDCEHRVQMYRDEQDHHWPKDENIRSQLVGLSGGDDRDQFEEKLREVLIDVHHKYTALFASEEDLSTQEGSLIFTGVEMEKSTKQTLQKSGFERPDMVWQRMAKWLGGRIGATRSTRARELLTRLAPRLIKSCANSGMADETFLGFADFFERLSAGIEVLSLLVNYPQTLDVLIEILSVAPQMSQKLADQSLLIAAISEPGFRREIPIIPDHNYEQALNTHTEFEMILDELRRVANEDIFKTIVRAIRTKNLACVGGEISSIATASIGAVLPHCVSEIERIYPKLEGDYAVLAFGKLASGDMNIGSDLDIILVYQPFGDGEQKTVLNDTASAQFNKLTRRLIAALSSQTSQGGLFEVDMALRPSGRAGPLAVSVKAFEQYYAAAAWTWEFMALSRARVVASSSPEFVARLMELKHQALQDKNYKGNLKSDILDMHRRIRNEKPCHNIWDLKNTKGGMRDVEFIAQYLVLKNEAYFGKNSRPHSTLEMLELAKTENWMSKQQAKTILTATRFFQDLIQVLAIVSDHTKTIDFENSPPNGSVQRVILQSMELENLEELRRTNLQYQKTIEQAFTEIFNL